MSHPTSKGHVWLILLAILLVAYLAGYAVIRADCRPVGAGLYTFPPYFSAGSSKVFYTVFQPLVIADQYCTGRVVIELIQTDDPGDATRLFQP